MSAPTLSTPRLRLRAHVMADLDALCDVFADDRSAWMGGPLDRVSAWRWLASEVGMWDLLGHGAWAVVTRDGTFVGQVSLLQPPHYPECELGWTLVASAEGKGYAQEAATAALHWAWAQGRETLVSYITPGNSRSIALAERLGATPDPDAPLPEGETPAETIVYRHRPDADGSAEAYA